MAKMTALEPSYLFPGEAGITQLAPDEVYAAVDCGGHENIADLERFHK